MTQRRWLCLLFAAVVILAGSFVIHSYWRVNEVVRRAREVRQGAHALLRQAHEVRQATQDRIDKATRALAESEQVKDELWARVREIEVGASDLEVENRRLHQRLFLMEGETEFRITQEPVVGAVVAPKQLVILGGYKSGHGCYEQLTSLSAVSHPTVPTDAYLAHFQVETQNVRWRDDYSTGVMKTFTDTTEAVFTMESGHGITTGDTVSVWWGASNERIRCAVDTVSSLDVTVDDGTGTNFTDTVSAGTEYEIGIDPKTTVGMQLVAGEWLDNYDCELARIRFLEELASAIINCAYRKP